MDKGYALPSSVAADWASLRRTALGWPLTQAMLDHALILGAGLALSTLIRSGHWVTALLALPLLLVAARSMRGLECLVHEASHGNWTRRRWLNDALASILVAWPVGIDLAQYRLTHFEHHRYLGSEADPDWRRWIRLRLNTLDWSSPRSIGIVVVRSLAEYQAGWWATVGKCRSVVLGGLATHLAILGGLTAAAGPRNAVWVWAAGWLVPYVLVLPVVRCLGEIEEHNYRYATTVIKGTNTNVGTVQRWILHPHGDAYHTVHHLHPLIPAFRCRQLHHALVEADGSYRALVPMRRRYTVEVEGWAPGV